MPAIITVTFNPAIDKSTTVPALIAEKKLQCTTPFYEPGGGGINVARAVKKLGGNAIAYYLAGGCTGKMFTQLLTSEGIEVSVTETNKSTRENLVVFETASQQQYRFGMPGPVIAKTEWQACLTGIENTAEADFIVASGSLPRGVPADIYARIATIAQKKNAKLIVDTSGEALKQAAEAGAYLIKPNLGELAALLGKEELSIERVDEAAREIINKGKCEVVVVSMGPAGAMLVTKEVVRHILPPAVKIKSTVGAGDSMVAGIVLSLAQNKSIEEAAQYGVACGTAATMNPGTELCRKEDADHLYKLIRLDK